MSNIFEARHRVLWRLGMSLITQMPSSATIIGTGYLNIKRKVNMQFDYVTGLLFFWTVGVSLLVGSALYILALVIQHRKNKETERKFQLVSEEFTRFDTRLIGIEKLWLDAENRGKKKNKK